MPSAELDSRPAVTVVMPFAGSRQQARAAMESLESLRTRSDDVLILSDNTGTASPVRGVTLVRADGERSPAFARNRGAQMALTEWVLFIDADCNPLPGLLDAYFSQPIDEAVGALAGEVVPAPGALTLAARYAGARNFLRQETHLAHSYRPRAAAANLMVRRAAFEQLGGFYEGLRAAEDTDFAWRLQAAGWRLEIRAGARVEHRYRAGIGELRRQWRGYAAGRAWLARRYDGFEPEPALVRAVGRAAARLATARGRGGAGTSGLDGGGGVGRSGTTIGAAAAPGRSGDSAAGLRPLERASYFAIDVLLGLDELAGFALSNRPRHEREREAQVVLVADRFPALEDPMVDFALSLAGVRVEARARPESLDPNALRALRVHYREDDGTAARVLALIRLATRRPLRLLTDMRRHGDGDRPPTLLALAPAVLRLQRDPDAGVRALGGASVQSTARRLAQLSGHRSGTGHDT